MTTDPTYANPQHPTPTEPEPDPQTATRMTEYRQSCRQNPQLQTIADRSLESLRHLSQAMCSDPEDRRKIYLLTQQIRETLGIP